MKQDRFDEFYILQAQAKGLEKRNKNDDALDIYLDILDNYFPDTDFSFERAVILLEKKQQYEKASEVCKLAIERIKAGDIKGTISFFEMRFEKCTEKRKGSTSTTQKNAIKNKNFIIASLTYTAVGILLSVPNKFFKLAFLLFIGIAGLLVLEIFKRLKNNISIKIQTFLLISTLIGALVAATNIPPPEWTSFFSLKTLSEIGTGQTVVSSKNYKEENKKNLMISEADVSTLNALYENNLITQDYTLSISDNTILLTMILKPGTSDESAKDMTFKILKELNDIKGFKGEEARLGNLYKHYKTTIVIYDNANILKIKGAVNRFTQKISWQ